MPEMTIEVAKQVANDCQSYIRTAQGADQILLDGWFSPTQLRALALICEKGIEIV